MILFSPHSTLYCAFVLEEIVKTIYHFIVFFAGACYGILSTFVKIAYAHGLTLTDVSGTQCFFGMAFLWMAVLFSKKVRVTPFHVITLGLTGIPMALTTIFYYHSLETLSASMAVVFLFQSIWMGSVVEAVLARHLPSKGKMISILCCLTGTILAAGLIEGGADFTFSSGMIFGLLSALSYTAVITASSLLGEGLTPSMKGALMATGDTIFTYMILPPAFFLFPDTWSTLLPFGLLLGIFGVALPPFLLSWGMPHVGPALGSILVSAELPVALLMALVVLGESITWIQWAGILFIGLGIVIGNRKK